MAAVSVSKAHSVALGVLALLLSSTKPAQGQELLPLPDELKIPIHQQSKIGAAAPVQSPQGMDAIKNTNILELEGRDVEIHYSNDESRIEYTSNSQPFTMRTDSGIHLEAIKIAASLKDKSYHLTGPVRAYMGESLALTDSAQYFGAEKELTLGVFRAKVNGIIVRGNNATYGEDKLGRKYIKIQDAYLSTEDVEKPTSWIGAGEILLYLNDSAKISRLSVAGEEEEWRVPIISKIALSHSLNPREGYLPMPGTKGIWGGYLLNQYGILLGNRRVQNGIPTADYLLNLRADFRTRRGVALGFDLENIEKCKESPEMKGLSIYLINDADTTINPTNIERVPIDKQRYRFALQSHWQLGKLGDIPGQWTLRTNLNLLSDQYVLRDYFEQLSRQDDKPDNTVAIVNQTNYTESMFLTRFAPNDYYSTDERAEFNYYRVRQPIAESPISYETRNSIGIMRQKIPHLQRVEYENALQNVRSEELKNYYRRLLNDGSYARFSSTHELSTSFKLWRFINITPKAGAAYSGYYDVERVGSDNRFIGYIGCDFDIKLNRHFSSAKIPSMGIDGLTHVIHPYASFSQTTLSSSNPLIPQIDAWTGNLGGINPMPLDLSSFTGIDGWCNWTIWRTGIQNVLTTEFDGEMRNLLTWNTFIDINIENEFTTNRYSNIYSILQFSPTNRFSINSEMQLPYIKKGSGYKQYNNYISYRPVRELELNIGHRYINDHPIQIDASQLYVGVNMRINENYSVAGRWYWEAEEKRMPIQQYSIFRSAGAWYIGATLYQRDNGGRKETGFGISFTLGETGTAVPIPFF